MQANCANIQKACSVSNSDRLRTTVLPAGRSGVDWPCSSTNQLAPNNLRRLGPPWVSRERRHGAEPPGKARAHPEHHGGVWHDGAEECVQRHRYGGEQRGERAACPNACRPTRGLCRVGVPSRTQQELCNSNWPLPGVVRGARRCPFIDALRPTRHPRPCRPPAGLPRVLDLPGLQHAAHLPLQVP